jgi:hypothetical protein
MTSESTPPWDFAPIYDLLHAFNSSPSVEDDPADHGATPIPLDLDPSDPSPKPGEPAKLGDFSRVYEFLGIPIERPRPGHESTGSPSTAPSHHSTPPSSIIGEAIHINEVVDRVKEVRWTDQVDGTELADPFESEPELLPHSTRRRARRRGSSNASADEFIRPDIAKKKFSLAPAWARPKSERSLWVPPPKPKIQVDPVIIQPIDSLTAEERKEKLLRKLKARFRITSDSLGNKDQDGIHIFVDCSNIIIGFYNALKIRRGQNIRAYTKQVPVSWHSLALIMERGMCNGQFKSFALLNLAPF